MLSIRTETELPPRVPSLFVYPCFFFVLHRYNIKPPSVRKNDSFFTILLRECKVWFIFAAK